MVCTIKNSNTFLTFCFFLIPHTLPLGRYVSTSRHQNALDMHFQLSIYRNSLKWMIFALSPFSPISLMQDYIYSKYPTQLTQLNNTHLKNLASNQIRRCRVRNSKFVFFLLYARKRMRIFCLIIAWKKCRYLAWDWGNHLRPYQSFIF